MNKRMIAVVLGLAAFSLSTPCFAQGSLATKWGEKLAEKAITSIFGSLVGKGFESIFGDSGPKGPTLAEISDAISKGFENAALQETMVDNQNLSAAIRTYVYTQSKADNWVKLENIVEATANVQSRVTNYASKVNFMQVMPLFVSATNARIAFMTEQMRYQDSVDPTSAAHIKRLLGTELVLALTWFTDMMNTDFGDPRRGEWPCMHKEANQRIYFPIGAIKGMNLTEKGNDISTQWCFGNGRIIKDSVGESRARKQLKFPGVFGDSQVINMGGVATARSTDIMPIHGAPMVQFVARDSTKDYTYKLHTTPNLYSARMLRNQINLTAYPKELGDLKTQVINWLEIINATAPDEMTTA
jgi:hypothetical protein